MADPSLTHELKAEYRDDPLDALQRLSALTFGKAILKIGLSSKCCDAVAFVLTSMNV